MTTNPDAHYLPILVRDGGVTDWERKFCASLIAQQRRGRQISGGQAQTLSRIAAAFRRRVLSDDGVIE